MSLMNLDKLSVFRGDCPVVDTVSLVLEPGDFVGLIGPNGAGKTTLMRAALGILEHTGSSSLSVMPQSDRAKQAAWLNSNLIIHDSRCQSPRLDFCNLHECNCPSPR